MIFTYLCTDLSMSYNKHALLLFYLFVFFASPSAKAQLSSSSLTVENGLSQNSVISIAQDSAGFVWLGTRQGLNRYDGHYFKIYKSAQKNSSSISSGEVTSLLTDAKGTLWVGTSSGLNRYNEQKDAFSRIKELGNSSIEVLYQDDTNNIWIGTLNGLKLLLNKEKNLFKPFLFSPNVKDPINSIYALFKDKHENLWIGTGNGLIVLTNKNGKYQYKKINTSTSLPSSYITSITSDFKGNIWLGTANGLCRFDYSSHTFKVFQHDNKNPKSVIHNDIREINIDNKGLLWIGTQDGLSILNPQNDTFSNYQHDPEINSTISHNSIHSIFTDRNRTTWIGTYFGGVNIIYPISTRFKIYRNSKFVPSISGNVLSSVLEDKEHNLWIGTEGGGLNYFNRKTHTFKSYKTNPADSFSISSNLVKIMRKEGPESDNLIIGTHRGGINIFTPSTGKFRHIKNIKDSLGTVGTAEIIALQVDKKGTIWIGTASGLTILKKKDGNYPDRTSRSILNRYMHNKGISSIFEDSQENIWIGTYAGLYRYKPKTTEFTLFRKNETSSNALQSDYINCITENRAKEILIGTYFGGLSIYSPKTNTFKTYREKNGLINDNVLGIIEDENRNLWISTANGLSELHPGSGRFRSYTKSDGLAGNEFNARSYFVDSKGEIFLGGINGLTSFYPKDIQLNNFIAPFVFTGLKLFNQQVDINGQDGLLAEQLNEGKTLTFNHEQNQFTIEFALLNYIKPDKNKYAYKLEGFDRDWTYTSTPSATYTNLPAGKYQFIVKGVNNDGIPGERTASIKIHIHPAIWASWWAYLLYTLLFVAALFLIIRYLFIRALLKRTEDVQKMKLQFFTNVSHEIRTPLTLILGPLESLLKNTKNLPEINKQVVPIKQNADRLMRLVTELMDFRKTETGNLKLHVEKQDIIRFTQDIFDSFEHLAKTREIEYSFKYDGQPIEIWFDKEQMEKVFFNLLSNAFKFTNNNGKIGVLIEEAKKDVRILISDNGIGIPEESQDKLFVDFFQVDTPNFVHIGSGIGLALSKSIVSAHTGTILIESIPESETTSRNTCFTVLLKKDNSWLDKLEQKPLDLSQYTSSVFSQPVPVPNVLPQEITFSKKRTETILLVEDNHEIRQMLNNSIGLVYQILEAENGQMGLEIATEHLPDLVISDVVMPVMNGLELCKQLKTDERTSHIPVLLLTARASYPQQVDGLETGADVYVTKPFGIELLMLNIRNLLQSRENIRKKFSEQPNLKPGETTVNAIDHAFMLKVIQFIEQRMANQDFGVPELAKEVGMSQPILYKKIRAITDLSVNDFIKSIRLKKAAILLEERVHNISEISFLIGFNDPKYFSREFKKQYGYTPRVYLNNSEKTK